MQERGSPSGHRNELSESLVRPGRVLDSLAVQQRFFGPDESAIGPSRFRFDPPDASTRTQDAPDQLAKHAKRRNRAVWAQAFVLFNVVGIPMSQGVYLEYFYTAALPTSSLVVLAVIPGLQILCILSTPILVGWFYCGRGQRSDWKAMFVAASVVAVCAQLPLQWLDSYIPTLILQGPLLGIALGTLFTLSILALSSHYKLNLPLVSTMSGSVGFLGAVVYSVIAREGFSGNRTVSFARMATSAVLAATLIAANVLINRADSQSRSQMSKLENVMTKSIGSIWKEKGTLCFILGYILVFFGIFVFPIYAVLLLAQQPALGFSSTGYLAVVAALVVAAGSACICAGPALRRHLGPVNTFVAAAVFSGAASILPVWMPTLWLSSLSGAAYGIGLGAIVALHIKVTTVFHAERVVWHPDMPARVAMMMAFGGVSAFAGLLVSAALMESMKSGARLASAIAGGGLVIGALFIAFARWSRCGEFSVAI